MIMGMWRLSGGVELTDSPMGESLRNLVVMGCWRVGLGWVCFCWKATRHLFSSRKMLSSSYWLIGSFV